MDLFDKIYHLHHLLKISKFPVSRRKIEQELECSQATAKRVIAHMRDYLGAPIAYNGAQRGYAYDQEENRHFELPGLWFNASELHALLSFHHLLTEIQFLL